MKNTDYYEVCDRLLAKRGVVFCIAQQSQKWHIKKIPCEVL
jgi:hypothetical protein